VRVAPRLCVPLWARCLVRNNNNIRYNIWKYLPNILQGVTDIQIDVAKKEVVVQGTADSDALLAAIKKTGKAVSVA